MGQVFALLFVEYVRQKARRFVEHTRRHIEKVGNCELETWHIAPQIRYQVSPSHRRFGKRIAYSKNCIELFGETISSPIAVVMNWGCAVMGCNAAYRI